MKRFKNPWRIAMTLAVALALFVFAVPVPTASAANGTVMTLDNSYWGVKTDDAGSAAANVEALNRALTWASQNNITTVRLAKGTYYVDGQHDRVYSVSDKSITLPSNMTLDLGGSTLIQIPNGKDGYAIFTIIGSSNVGITNGTLVGDKDKHDYSGGKTSTHEFGLGIDVRGGSNIKLTNLDIYNMTGDSILVGGKDTYLSQGGTLSQNVTITGCKLHDNRRQGISVMGVRTMTVSSCQIYNIGISNGTLPCCGIDLENELDWPIENVRITGNKFYNNKKAAVAVQQGSLNTTIQGNNITGTIALVYGEGTRVDGNQITNGGVYSVDTMEPLRTVITGNYLTNSNIEVFTNYGTVISSNTISEGVIRFNYANGVLYKNKITNSKYKTYAIQVYADKQAQNYTFQVCLYGNETYGRYAKAVYVNKYAKLKVYYDEASATKFISEFDSAKTLSIDSETIPTGIAVVSDGNIRGLVILASGILAAVAAVLAFMYWRRRKARRSAA